MLLRELHLGRQGIGSRAGAAKERLCIVRVKQIPRWVLLDYSHHTFRFEMGVYNLI